VSLIIPPRGINTAAPGSRSHRTPRGTINGQRNSQVINGAEGREVRVNKDLHSIDAAQIVIPSRRETLGNG
jgi:hypothetical protein